MVVAGMDTRMEKETLNLRMNTSTRKSDVLVISRNEEDVHLKGIVVRGREPK